MRRQTRELARTRGERGFTSIEILGILPIAILVTGAIFQLFLIAYSAIEAESAARLAAREASKGTPTASAEAMAEGAINSVYQPVAIVTSGNQAAAEPGLDEAVALEDSASATVKATVPFLGFGVEGLDITVQRHSVMPVTD